MCRDCPLAGDEPDPWVMHLVGLHLLRRGGYPFRANDLPVETWQDLGQLQLYLEDRKQLVMIKAMAATAGRRILP